jgi:putative transposase
VWVGFQVSERRGCRVISLPRSTTRYQSLARDQAALRLRLRDLAAARVRYGYRRLHVLLRREGWPVNHTRGYRLYRLEGLAWRLTKRRQRASALRVARAASVAPNERWSMDFMHDQLADGRRLRVLTIVANFSRVSPALRVSRSLTGRHVVEVLEHLKAVRGVPRILCVDKGPEFTSRALDVWAHQHGVELDFSRPGTPTDNPFTESFNAKLRVECLDQHWFTAIEEAEAIIEEWREDYNTQRPHSALGGLTPEEFASGFGKREASRERVG